MLKTHDGPIRTWILAKSAEKEIPYFQNMRSAEDIQQLAIAGFEALGPEGAPAVRELSELLDVPHYSFAAFRSLAGIGKPAELVLSQVLTNQDWNLRYHAAVLALSGIMEDAEDYIARVKDRLQDSEDSVRFAAVQAVGGQTGVPEVAVPLLIQALADSSHPVVSQANKALAEFGTNAASAFLPLRHLAEKGRETTMNGALRAMLSISPDQALPVLLGHINSPEPRHRRVAAALLGNHTVESQAVTQALETATTDTDPQVARLATMSLAKRHARATQGTNKPAITFPTLPELE